MIPTKIRIGIADEDILYRRSITGFLGSECPIALIIEADNGLHLLELLSDTQPEILLVNIQMPVMNGIQVTRIIQEKFPYIKIIAFSHACTNEHIISACLSGIKSFILKEHPEEFPKAIRTVYDGGVYFPDHVAEIIRQHYMHLVSNEIDIRLSRLELHLLQAICIGLSSTEIAKSVNKSPRTVEDYRKLLYRKFNVRNKEQLISTAVRFGFITF